MVEVVRRRQAACRADVRIALQQGRKCLERMIDGLAFVHREPRLKKVEQRHTLTIGLGIYEGRILRKGRRRDRTRRPDRASEIVAAEIAGNAFHGDEVERLVPLDRAAKRTAELLPVKVLQLRAIRQVSAQSLEALK